MLLSAFPTASMVMPWAIPRFLSLSGEMNTGLAPEKIIADMTDLWTFRGTIILSSGANGHNHRHDGSACSLN